MPRALQPENYFVIFMWRAAIVCQTSRFFLWEWTKLFMPASAMQRACTAPCWCSSSIEQFLHKVAENRLFQFIHTEIGWICISSQNNPEIWLHSIPNPWNEQFFSWLAARSCVLSVCEHSHSASTCARIGAFVWQCVCLSTFLLVFILEREAANLHGATGGYTELSPQLFSGYSQQFSGSP